MFGTGWPSNAGGRLVGSLSGLPYALAEAEQNFLIPSREQALIWGDLVPQMILSAKIPRWWNVTPAQMHWVGLHMRYGGIAAGGSGVRSGRREQVLEALSHVCCRPRARSRWTDLLDAGEVMAAVEQVTPSEMFAVARELPPSDRTISRCSPAEMPAASTDRRRRSITPPISRAFGTPKPTLANSYQPELLNLRTFPTLMGYSSRIMAESWESNMLYYAALADEIACPPVAIECADSGVDQQTVEQIFATHLEDWPALLRSLRRWATMSGRSAQTGCAGAGGREDIARNS